MDGGVWKGVYYTRLENTIGAREKVYGFLEQIVGRDDFWVLTQSRKRHGGSGRSLSVKKPRDQSFALSKYIDVRGYVSLKRHLLRVDQRMKAYNLPYLINNFYGEGYGNIEVGFNSGNENKMTLGLLISRCSQDENDDGGPRNVMYVSLKRSGIHIYTFDEGINKQLRKFPDIKVHKDQRVDMDNRAVTGIGCLPSYARYIFYQVIGGFRNN